jgi:hypothetical protein
MKMAMKKDKPIKKPSQKLLKIIQMGGPGSQFIHNGISLARSVSTVSGGLPSLGKRR